MFYAQLNENDICIGVSELNGEVPEYNYATNENYDPITGTTETEQRFVSRMIKIPVYSTNFIGLKYNEGTWERVEVIENVES